MTAYSPEAWGARCFECPLRTQGAPMVPPKWGSLAATDPAKAVPLVLIADSPNLHDVKRAEPFAGAPGVKLNEFLWRNGLKASQVLLSTYALLCRPEVPGETGRGRWDLKRWLAWWRKENAQRRKFKQPTTPSPFACCYPRLKNELDMAERMVAAMPQRAAGPRDLVVAPLGNFALGAAQGEPGKSYGIMKYRGSVIEPGKGSKP